MVAIRVSFIDPDDEGGTQLVLQFRDTPANDVGIVTWEFENDAEAIGAGIDFYDAEDEDGLYQIGIQGFERLIELFNEHQAREE